MIITATPLRISLLGGNTDFPKYFKKYGGAVLTMAIDKYIYCIVKERFDDQIWINYSQKEIVDNVKDIKHDLVREAMKLVGITKGVEITFLSDIPSQGTGLGSSSAVTVGLLHALHQYKGELIPSWQLAEEACQIEVDILKKPIGYQDQYAVTFGGFNLIEFKKDTVKIKPIILDKEDTLMLFYTGIQRKSDDILSKMELNKDILDQTKALVYESKYQDLGAYLTKHWELKKKLNSKVSNETIDNMLETAILNGADGGKIVGAGGGGFLLLVVPEEQKRNIRDLGWRELPFNISKDGSKVIFNIRS